MKRLIFLLALLVVTGSVFAKTTTKIISKESAKAMLIFGKPAVGPNSIKVFEIMEKLVKMKDVKYLKFTFTENSITVVGVNGNNIDLKLPVLIIGTGTEPGPCPRVCNVTGT